MNRGRIQGLLGPNSLDVSQGFGVDIVASQPTGIDISQSLTMTAVASLSGGATANDPLTIAPGWTFWLVGDNGLSGTTWTDQSGNGFNATSAIMPAITTNLLNGRTGITMNGATQHMVFSTLDLPPPGTTPSWIFAVWRWKTWTSGDNMYGASTSCMRLLQITSLPQVEKHNGVVSSTLSPALNTWQRSADYYSNTTSDYLKIGASTVTGVNCGNTDPAAGAFRIGSNNGGGAGSPDADLLCIGRLPRLPTGTEITNLDTWVTAYYGGTVAV
jgi:hypothetical protein